MSALRLGTRGSRLAMTQSRHVADLLRAHRPGVTVDLVEIRTTGDRVQDVRLGPALGQAFFTREIEDALLDGRIDLAVHSCKDLATVLPEGLMIGAVPEREDARDVLVSRAGPLASLPAGSRIGTASIRRQRFLAAYRDDLEFVDLRGNVPTRLAAVDEGRCDAAVLAAAGLRRLGMADRIEESLDESILPPAAAQGALAVQIREDDDVVRSIVAMLDHGDSRAAVVAERACLRRLEGGCQAPVGALARLTDGVLRLRAAVAGPDGVVSVDVSAGDDGGESLGTRAAESLLYRLGLDSLAGVTWAGKPPRRLETR